MMELRTALVTKPETLRARAAPITYARHVPAVKTAVLPARCAAACAVAMFKALATSRRKRTVEDASEDRSSPATSRSLEKSTGGSLESGAASSASACAKPVWGQPSGAHSHSALSRRAAATARLRVDDDALRNLDRPAVAADRPFLPEDAAAGGASAPDRDERGRFAPDAVAASFSTCALCAISCARLLDAGEPPPPRRLVPAAENSKAPTFCTSAFLRDAALPRE